MRTAIITLLVGLICVGTACSSGQRDGYQILVPGEHHGSDVSFPDVDGWYGLFETDSGHVLEPVEILTKACHDPAVDGLGDTTGISITVDDPRSMIFLVRSPRSLKTGLVRTHFVGDKWIYLGELTVLGEYALTALGLLTDEGGRSPREPLVIDYQLKLFKNPDHYGPRQVLVVHDRTCAEDTPSLLWAGDLDRDGKLDLFMDILNHYAGRHYALYLSSEAEDGELVKLVADLFIHGC